MATVFSTATLGLSIDTKQFNKDLKSASKYTEQALTSMGQVADTFSDRWNDLTGGLKDTKRIISGILVSQGFYALSNALLNAGAAALDFSMNMETAAVSLEYFVDAAEGTEEAAAQVQAYLREVNSFAARTPFSTDDVLTLSKYMQAVGVAMGQTQSVLSVITDTAAATGASEENLQRITFALGQMLTKGRLANEEIRQLANANIPVYQILQEEMGLTGDQISKIGNYWVDANDAVVAILNGLNKRYAGAADRIAETLTGLTDTIIDDAKIIADEAFGGIYDKVVGAAGSLRDTLDEWRTIVTEQGSMGLFNNILMEIDPTGEVGNQILSLIGNVRQLKDSFTDLYLSAKPVIKVFGQTFYAAVNGGMVVLTAFADVLDDVITFLDSAGLSTQVLAKGFAALFIAYKATKFISLFGQACWAAGQSVYSAASAITALLPASLTANAGIMTLTASVATLLAYAIAVAGIFGKINSSFAGLDTSGGGIANDYADEYKRYSEAMDEYNKKIEAYQEKYRDDYSNMASGNDTSISDTEDDDDDSSKSKSTGTKDDWVASFDEVYDVPNADDTGTYQDEVLADLGELLSALRAFEFPDFSDITLDKPEFDWDKVYDGSLWDGVEFGAGEDFWKWFLPSAIASGVIGLGKIFANQRAKLYKDVSDVIGKGNIGSVIVSDKEAAKAVAELTTKYEQGTKQLLDALEAVKRDIRTVRTLDSSAESYGRLGQDATALDRLNKKVAEISENLAYYSRQTGMKFSQSIKVQEIATALNEARLLVIDNAIKDLQVSLAEAVDPFERQTLITTMQALQKERSTIMPGMPAAVSTADEYAEQLDDMGRKLFKKLDEFGKQPFDKPTKLTRSYNDVLLTEISDELAKSKAALDRYIELYKGTDYYRETIVETLHKELGGLNNKYLKLFSTATQTARDFNAYATGSNALARTGNKLATESKVAAEKQATKVLDQVVDLARELSKLEPESLAATLADIDAKAAKAEADRAEQIAIAEKQRAEAAAARKQQAALDAQSRRTARSNAYNATLGQGAVAKPDTAGIEAIDEAAAEAAHEIQLLKDDLLQYRDTYNDYKSKGDTAGMARTQASIDATNKKLAELLGAQNSSLVKIERKVAALSAKQATVAAQVAKDLQAMLPRVPGLDEQTAAATAAWRASIQPAIVDALAANGIKLDDLRMTATKTIEALTGLSDYGKTLPQLVAEAFKDAGLFTKFLPNAMDPGLATVADRGVVLEKYFGSAADVSLSAHNVTVYQGGHAASPNSSLIVQYDFAAGGMGSIISGAADTVALDIKVTGADTVRAIEALSDNVEGNIYKASADILRQIGRNDNYYELMAQSYVFTGKNGGQLIGFANADFDYNTVIDNFSELLKRQMAQVFNNSAFDQQLLNSMSGRIFSLDAFNQAKKLSGKGSEYTWAQYEADVIAPLFQDPMNQFNADALAKSFKLIYLDYSNALRSIDLDEFAKQYTKMLSVFGVLGDSGEKYLTSYAKVLGYAEDITGALDMSAALKNYPAAARSINKWLQAILRDSDAMVKAGSVPKLFKQTIDGIVNDYVNALSAGATDATTTYTTRIRALRGYIKDLQSGNAIPDSVAAMFGRMAKAPVRYADSLSTVDKALAVLESTPSDVNKITSSIISVRTQMNRLKRAAATGMPVASKQITGLINTYEQAVNYLHLGTNQLAIDVGNQLQAIQRYVAGQGGSAVLSSSWTKGINLPMAFADVETTAQYVAASIAEGMNNGLLHLSKNTYKALTEALAGMQPAEVVDNLLPQLLNKINNVVGKTLVVDLETAGLPATSEFGTKYPAITQATVADQETGKMVSSYITTGDLTQDAVNLYRMQSLTNPDGTLSDVAKAWQKVTLDDIQGGMTIQQLWNAVKAEFGTGNTGTGWNAFGVTGFDYPIMRANGMPDNLLLPGEDLMTKFSNAVQQATGISKKFKLVDAYETIFGQFTEAAHLADNDVEMARRIANAMQDGTLSKILAGVDITGSEDAVTKLKAAGELYRNSLSTAADAVTEGAAGAAKVVEGATKPVADAVESAAESATKEAVDATSKISFKEAFESISRKASENIKEVFNQLWQPAKTLKERFATLKSDFNLFGRVDSSIFKNLPLDEVIDSWTAAANDLIDAQNTLKTAKMAGAADEVISSLESQVAELTKAYDLAGTNLYRTLVTQTNSALKGSDDIADAFTSYVGNIVRNDDYIAFYYDAAAKQFKTIGSQLNINGEELLKRLSSTVVYADDISSYATDLFKSVKAGSISFSDAAKEMDNLVSFAKLTGNKDIASAFERLRNAFNGIGDIDEAISTYATVLNKTITTNADDVSTTVYEAIKSLKHGGTLTADGVEAFAEAINKQVGDTVVIINKATGNVEFAGKAAASAIDDAAAGVSNSLGSMASKVLKTSFGTFSAFDIIGVGLDSLLELYNVNKLQGNIGDLINQLVSDDTRNMFIKAGVDLKETLGDSVYSGITNAFVQSAVVALMSNAIGTAAGAAAALVLASGPAGWIGAGVAALAGVGMNAVYNATGGNTATNKYAGNYERAVASGQFIDYDSLVQQLTDAGYTIESATKAADEANELAHQFYQRQIVQQASSGNMWESSKVSSWLHGDTTYYGTSGSTNDALRIAQAMGLIDVKAATRTDSASPDISYSELVVKDADANKQLEEIGKILGDQSLTLGEAVTINGEVYRYVERAGQRISYSSANIGMLADALDMVTTQGVTTGSVAESLLSTINSNDALSAAYDAEYGNLREAQNILGDYLKIYNEANGTDYTASYLDENGLSKQFLQAMIDIYEAQSAIWYNEASVRGTTDSANRNLLAGNTSTMLAGVDSSNWATALLNELSSYGLNFAAGSYTVDTAYGSESVPYTVLSTDIEELRDSLAGVRVGTTTLADGTVLDVSKLMVSTADAEILAEAGIQINSDGTISFMNALNEGVTGAERDMSLTAEAFSKSVLDSLSKNSGIAINFETGTLDFGDYSKVTKNMSSALFAMPSNIKNQLSEEMRDVIAQIGKVTDSGYLQITNKSILSGRQTIRQFIESAGHTVDELSPQVYNALMTIDALIQEGGGTIEENIIEWANGVVVPSPISADQLTPEIEAAFEKIGISFEEQSGQLMMVINQTGEKLTNGVTLISADKWNQLDEEIRNALTALGVTATQYGNDMMINLNGVMDSGIANIVSLFVDQPDLWNQIPDSVRQYLEEAGIITHDQLIEIQTTLSGGLVTITDGWVASWSTLGPEVEKSMNAAGLNTQNGLAEIHKYVGDANVGTMLEEGVVCYFDDLPPEIQEAMNAAGENLKGSKVILETATNEAVGGMLSVLSTTTQSISDETAQWKQMLDEALSYQQRLSNISASGSILHNKQGTATYTSNSKGEYTVRYNNVKYSVQATSLSDALKQIKDYYGVDLTNVKTEKYASGGIASGSRPVLAGELGDELAILPDGTTRLVGAGLYDVPAGTQIVNAEDTAAIMKYAGNVHSIEKLADGNTELKMDAQEPDTDSVYPEFIDLYRPILNEELRGVGELVAVSMKNAAETLVAEDDDRHDKLVAAINSSTEDLKAFIDSQRVSHEEMLSAVFNTLNSNLTSGLQQVASAVGATIDSLKSTISSLEHSLAASSKTTNALLDTSVDYSARAYEAAENGDYEGMMKALSDRYTKVGIIGTDYGNSQAEVTATAMSKYKNATIKANAYGGMVSDDQLVRVGEFGKKEAILPLEQPSVMASLGEEIGAYVGGLTAEQLQEILEEQLYATRESLAVAIDNAAKIIAEEQASSKESAKQSYNALSLSLDSGLSNIIETLNSGFSGISSDISSAASSIASSVSSALRSAAMSASNLAGASSSNNSSKLDIKTATSIAASVMGSIAGIVIGGTTVGRAASSAVKLGASKGSTAIKANAYGSLITGDQLIRVGEFGKNEAVLPLEQPSVMAKVGAAVGRYTGTALTAELLSGLLTEVTETQTEELSVAIDNSAKILGEELSSFNTDSINALRELQASFTDTGTKLTAAMSSTEDSVISAINSAASSICSAVKSISINIGSNIGGFGGSGAAPKGTVMSPNGAISTGITLGQKVFGAVLGATGIGIGKVASTVIGAAVGKKTKGSASGSLVTKDALYRAGELGLNEAIIPLEKPDIMRYVGSTIASYMPVEANELQGAVGMRNAGITAPSPAASPMQEDMTSLVSDVTQHVLESVLPAMSNMSGGEEAKTPVYVGTLIADERGLKQLERKLYVIRKAEEARRQ